MNRRQFAYVAALGSAVSAGTRAAGTQTGRIPEVAGLIAETVFLDDCVRVAMYDSNLSIAAKTALAAHGDHVRNGALSPARSGDANTGPQFALTTGRLASETLNRHRRPNSAEARLYQDIAVMRDLAAGAGCDPSRPSPVGDLLDLVHVRRRLALHTLIPDDADLQAVQAWLEHISTWWKDQRDLRAALAAAYSSPDKTKMREFAAGFYNPADPLIQLARGFQFGRLTPPDALPAALDQAAQGSGYARALADAAEALRKIPDPLQ
jgi:hypothetical protein